MFFSLEHSSDSVLLMEDHHLCEDRFRSCKLQRMIFNDQGMKVATVSSASSGVMFCFSSKVWKRGIGRLRMSNQNLY